MIGLDLTDEAVVDFNRELLKYDLRRMKKNMEKLNARVVENLDEYFDTVCILAHYDAAVFKKFFRRMLEKKSLKKI